MTTRSNETSAGGESVRIACHRLQDQELVTVVGRLRVRRSVRVAVGLRMSDPADREAIVKTKGHLAGSMTDRACGDVLRSMPDELCMDTPAGAALRGEWGFVDVYLSDLDPRARHELLAYGAEIGDVGSSVLVLIIPSGAIEENLPPLAGDELKQGRNGFTELTQLCAFRLQLELFAFLRMNRLGRVAKFGAQILHMFLRRPHRTSLGQHLPLQRARYRRHRMKHAEEPTTGRLLVAHGHIGEVLVGLKALLARGV